MSPDSAPPSKAALTRLGRRIGLGQQLSASDQEMFEDFVGSADARQAGVVERLQTTFGDGAFIRGRAKTTLTLTQKLRRETHLRLPDIRDVAGVRLVAALTLSEQTELAREVASDYDEDPARAIVDRRSFPVQGYRAVHVIVRPDGWPVEIQVRTELQHAWAQTFEATADAWGRGLRYPNEYESVLTSADRRLAYHALLEVSTDLADVESAIDRLASSRRSLDSLRQQHESDLHPAVVEAAEAVRAAASRQLMTLSDRARGALENMAALLAVVE